MSMKRIIIKLREGDEKTHPNHKYITVSDNRGNYIGECYYVRLEGENLYGLDRTCSSGNPAPRPDGVMFVANVGKCVVEAKANGWQPTMSERILTNK